MNGNITDRPPEGVLDTQLFTSAVRARILALTCPQKTGPPKKLV